MHSLEHTSSKSFRKYRSTESKIQTSKMNSNQNVLNVSTIIISENTVTERFFNSSLSITSWDGTASMLAQYNTAIKLFSRGFDLTSISLFWSLSTTALIIVRESSFHLDSLLILRPFSMIHKVGKILISYEKNIIWFKQ